MDVRPIRTEEDYDWALEEIARYFENVPAPGTPEADRFDVLAALIEAYENRHWQIEAMDPVETLKAFMEASGRTQADLAQLLGARSRASEILKRKRRLSIEMIYRINREWKVPADLLVPPYHTDDRAA